MIFLLILSQLLIVLGEKDVSSASYDRLSVSIPPYAYDFGVLHSIIRSAILFTVSGFCMWELPKYLKYQHLALSVISIHFFVKHMILSKLSFIDWIPLGMRFLEILFFVTIAVLSLNIKFRKLFNSIGAAYCISYEIELITGWLSASSFWITIILFTLVFLVISKNMEDNFSVMIKFIITPLVFITAMNVLIKLPIQILHNSDSNIFNIILCRIILCLVMILAFLISYFFKYVKTKYEEISGLEIRQEAKEENKEESAAK